MKLAQDCIKWRDFVLAVMNRESSVTDYELDDHTSIPDRDREVLSLPSRPDQF
jgi:hypothetical protein